MNRVVQVLVAAIVCCLGVKLLAALIPWAAILSLVLLLGVIAAFMFATNN